MMALCVNGEQVEDALIDDEIRRLRPSYEKRPSVPCPFEQVREVIVRDLKNQAREKAIENFLDARKAASVIEER